ncbi:flagellar FlbD family protein [Natroniella acetigena]|nr:flagellar FlbD family protein [Natroniella acetigena]MCK8826308.1 flagellar FlbD family protein [Natroniella acetigena]
MIIKLRRLNDSEIVVNAELIETIEATPDTVITLTTNHRLIVKEDVDDIIEMIIDYKRRIRLKPEWE